MCQGSLRSSRRLPNRNPKYVSYLKYADSRSTQDSWRVHSPSCFPQTETCCGLEKETTVFRSSPGWPGTDNGIQANLQLLDNPLACLSGEEKKNSSLWINKPTLILDSKHWNFVLTHNTESFGQGSEGRGAVIHLSALFHYVFTMRYVFFSFFLYFWLIRTIEKN